MRGVGCPEAAAWAAGRVAEGREEQVAEIRAALRQARLARAQQRLEPRLLVARVHEAHRHAASRGLGEVLGAAGIGPSHPRAGGVGVGERQHAARGALHELGRDATACLFWRAHPGARRGLVIAEGAGEAAVEAGQQPRELIRLVARRRGVVAREEARGGGLRDAEEGGELRLAQPERCGRARRICGRLCG
jgi:hypothetical protein